MEEYKNISISTSDGDAQKMIRNYLKNFDKGTEIQTSQRRSRDSHTPDQPHSSVYEFMKERGYMKISPQNVCSAFGKVVVCLNQNHFDMFNKRKHITYTHFFGILKHVKVSPHAPPLLVLFSPCFRRDICLYLSPECRYFVKDTQRKKMTFGDQMRNMISEYEKTGTLEKSVKIPKPKKSYEPYPVTQKEERKHTRGESQVRDLYIRT